MLLLLLFLLLILLLINYWINDRELLAPSFVFTAAFCLSCMWALAYQVQWDLSLHENTFLVIFGGVLEFSLVTFFLKLFRSTSVSDNRTNIDLDNDSNDKSVISFQKWKIAIVIGMQLLAIAYTVYEVQKIAPAGSLSDSIYSYRSQVISPTASQMLESLPRLLTILRSFTDALGYFFAYILAQKIIFYKRLGVIELVICSLSIVNSLMLGSRTGAVALIFSFLIFLYCIYKKSMKWNNQGNFGTLIAVLLLFIVVIFSFQALASLLGRDITRFSMGEYLSIYLGAEIKNLDVFLQSGSFPIHTGFFQSQTFIYVTKFLNKLLSIGEAKYSLNLPFLYANGYNLGNVYTTFYAYIYDFGYMGIPVLVGLMAFISEYVFEKVKGFREMNTVSISVLIYGKVVFALALSFFSNKFYENIFTMDFVQLVFFWLILRFIFGQDRPKGVRLRE